MAICASCGNTFDPPPKSRRRTCSRSCAVALAWKDPDKSAKRRASILLARRTPESRAASTAANNRRWAKPGERERMSEWNRRRWADPAIKTSLSYSIRAAALTPERRKKASLERAAAWQDPEVRSRMMAGMIAAHQRPEHRALMSAALRARWQDPVKRLPLLAAVRRNSVLARGRPRPNRRKLHHKDIPVKKILVVKSMPAPLSKDQARSAQKARLQVLRRGGRMRPTQDLNEVIAKSSAPIKRYPTGVPKDWKPSWME